MVRYLISLFSIRNALLLCVLFLVLFLLLFQPTPFLRNVMLALVLLITVSMLVVNHIQLKDTGVNAHLKMLHTKTTEGDKASSHSRNSPVFALIVFNEKSIVIDSNAAFSCLSNNMGVNVKESSVFDLFRFYYLSKKIDGFEYTDDSPIEIHVDLEVEESIQTALKKLTTCDKVWVSFRCEKNVVLNMSAQIHCMDQNERRLYICVLNECRVREQLDKRKTVNNQNESEYLRAQKMNLAISESSLDALITIDKRDIIIEFSAAAERTFGWKRENVIGQSMNEIIVPEPLREAHKKGMKHFILTGEGPLIGKRVEIEALHKDGHLFPVELALIGIEHEGERYATAFIRDISERKQAEQELLNSKNVAVAASKAKSRFLSYMSHEIRSPLNAVLGALELLNEKLTSKEQSRLFDIAQSSGENLLNVINEILDFSKIEAGHIEVTLQKTNVREMIRKLVLVSDSKRKKEEVELLCFVSEKVPTIMELDVVKVRQILNILLDNALKFTKSGAVGVRLCIDDTVHDSGNKSFVLFEVYDTGFGISKEMQDNIFSEFEQVDASRDTRFGGTGLGLAIAKKYCEAMASRLDVSSQLESGSQFLFRLPISGEEELGLAGELVKPISLTLWVLTDNSAVRDYLSYLLTNTSGLEKMALTFFDSISELLASWDLCGVKKQPLLLIDSTNEFDSSIEALVQEYREQTAILYHSIYSKSEWLKYSCRYIEKPIFGNSLIRFFSGESESDEQLEVLPEEIKYSGNILLVDDVEANRMVAAELLKGKGFNVSAVVDGLEAVKYCESNKYDVILMDVRMPRLNGIDATRIIRTHHGINESTPIIALTANAETSEIERCKEVGFNDFVSKPFDTARLLSVIHHHTYPDEDYENENSIRGEIASHENNGYLNSPLLDMGVINQLIKDTSLSIIPNMVTVFCDELDNRVALLLLASAQANVAEIREQAHALKSCCGTFGAERLHQASMILEEHVKLLSESEKLNNQLVADVLKISSETKVCYEDYRCKLKGEISRDINGKDSQ